MGIIDVPCEALQGVVRGLYTPCIDLEITVHVLFHCSRGIKYFLTGNSATGEGFVAIVV